MSTIGSITTAGLNLAGSIIGSSRPETAGDRNKSSAADQKTWIDLQTLAAKSLGDVADAEFGAERDAEGNLGYRRRDGANGPPVEDDETATGPAVIASQPAVDPFGDRGQTLDLEA